MIPNDQPLRRQTISRMIFAIIDHPENELTAWEQDFIASIEEQFKNRGDLSNKQCEILEKIYDK